MSALNTDLLKKLSRKWTGQIGAAGVSDAVITTIPLSSTTNLATDTAVVATIDRVDANGVKTPTLEESIIGVVSGSNLSTCVRGAEGTAQAHSAGAVVEILVTAKGINDIVDWGLVAHNQDGTHKSGSVLTSPVFQGTVDGWISANETWAYASATTITVPAGAAAKYAVGDRIRWKQGAGYKYGVLVTVADTLLTIAVNTDFTVATPTAITDNYYSHQASPIGYPQTFSYTPSYSANGSMTYGTVTTDTAKFSVIGNVCSLVIFVDGTTGGSASNEVRATLPITTTNTNYTGVGAGWILDGGGAISGICYITSSTILAVTRYDGVNWGIGASRKISISVTFRI